MPEKREKFPDASMILVSVPVSVPERVGLET
jgi:hypothetical protein